MCECHLCNQNFMDFRQHINNREIWGDNGGVKINSGIEDKLYKYKYIIN